MIAHVAPRVSGIGFSILPVDYAVRCSTILCKAPISPLGGPVFSGFRRAHFALHQQWTRAKSKKFSENASKTLNSEDCMDATVGIPVIYSFGPFRLDASRHVLTKKEGTRVDLTPAPMTVLLALIQRAGQLVSKVELEKKVWGRRIGGNSLPQQIHVLRRTLGETPFDNQYIETIPRQGYRFVAPVKEVRTYPEGDSAKLLAGEDAADDTSERGGGGPGEVSAEGQLEIIEQDELFDPLVIECVEQDELFTPGIRPPKVIAQRDSPSRVGEQRVRREPSRPSKPVDLRKKKIARKPGRKKK